MPIPSNKNELIKAIKDNYKKLDAEIIDIPLHLIEIKDLDGYSKMQRTELENGKKIII